MNAMRSLSVFSVCLVVAVVLILSVGCKKSSDADPSPTGELVGSAGCKEYSAVGTEQEKTSSATPTQDCLQWNYDGSSVLTLTHIDAGFNCCPGDISATVQISGNNITITEAETQQGCHCLCLFDVYYRIENLSPGTYTITLTGLYLEDDQFIQMQIDLSEEPAGTECFDRGYYPWGVQE